MLNNCTFQGRFAADPEMRTTQSGLTVASFRMAVDRDNVGQDGRRATDWLNFVAWRKTAEFVCQYFRKGSTALVECQCQTRSYEDKNGQKRTATEFVVQKIHFCVPRLSSVSMTAAKHRRPIRISSPSRWDFPPRASGSSGRAQKLLLKLYNPVTRRAIPMISPRLTIRTICRSDRNKEVVGW